MSGRQARTAVRVADTMAISLFFSVRPRRKSRRDDIKFSKRRGVRNLTQTCDPPHIFPSAQKAEL